MNQKVRHIIFALSTLTAALSVHAQETAYKASTVNKPINIVNIASLEAQAEAQMQAGAFGYIRGGAEDEKNLRSNTSAFDKKYIMPRIMQGIELKDIQINTKFLGIDLKTPIIQAPMAAQGLANIDGELSTAKGMAKAGSIFSLSTYGNKTIEEVAQVAGKSPFFFQLYMSKNDKFNEFTLKRAKQNGAKAIILTVDAAVGGYREDDIKNNFEFPLGFANLELFAKQNGDTAKTGKGTGISEIFAQAKQGFTPADINYVKKMTGLPVIVKGIQSAEDADMAIRAGADAIWVSNHGGRQLDSGPASFDVLPSIAKVVNKRVPIVFDSGVRRGSHVFKALASGADIVAIGRPVLYGLQLGGAEGVNSVVEQFNKELRINMMLAGVKDIEAVKQTRLYSDKDFE
ncbi:lactate oxidase [Acinetobacter larvae]|uniref:Lactate oxidase n=1 Tax=Acinetobacter larvae TaxID=1789224 RepID=A0A1B2M0Y1_9GAMM|nr:lactate oxidase [Acinetobacter larvae]AOA58850.1 lactate oxidase [Acinetobacter larvae]